MLTVVAAGALAGCQRGGAGVGDSPDATVVFQSALTSPATWSNLWGSWPSQRYAHASAYDTDRGVIVTYGGQYDSKGPFYGDVWEWNGARGSWQQRPSPASAGPRSGHGLVYDPELKKTLMWGGYQPEAFLFFVGMQEWDNDASTWVKRAATGGLEPTMRHDHIMVYDPDRKRTVVFGGQDENNNRLDDVWEWNSATATWTQRTITGTTKPSGRFGHGGVYDASRKRLVIYGGNTGTTRAGSWVNETWELDLVAGAWQPYTTAPNEVPAYSYTAGYTRLGYDAVTHKVVLYQTGDYVYEWDPATPTWKKVAATHGIDAPSSYYPTVTYDPGRAALVVVGGYYSPRTPWEINTTNYTMVNRSNPNNGPIEHEYSAVAFDTKNEKLIVFGGYSALYGQFGQDLWEWSRTSASFMPRTTGDDKPEPRALSAMVYDSKRHRMLLYGGIGDTTFDDLWQWDVATSTWSKIAVPGTRPARTYGHWMFYDAVRDKVLLMYGSGNVLWELDPTVNTWKNRTPVPQPALLNGRSTYQMAFDSSRGKLVLLGGYNNGVYTSDVVEWDTTTGLWEARRPAVAADPVPSGRYDHAIVYDEARKVIVMVGGHAAAAGGLDKPLNDSWEWDGQRAVWTETSPAGGVLRPLPREKHRLVHDNVRGKIYLLGGTSLNDITYGADYTYTPQELWEYLPNGSPRPNGAGCTPVSAASCQSKNCVDGVCCDQATCAGTCKACNIAGKEGVCSDVPVGLPDDSCPSDQSCDENHACKARPGQVCSSPEDCVSKNCVDGVCCDTACTTPCKACNLAGKQGVCSNIAAGNEDPALGACLSTDQQPRQCDGNGTCLNGKKANGKPCSAAGQCTSGFCIDGVCCSQACNQICYQCNRAGYEGTCATVLPGLVDHSATSLCDAAMQSCSGFGACLVNKKPNGDPCDVNSDCGSGLCADGVCCNTTCTGTCQACNVPGRVGTCGNVLPGDWDSWCGAGQFCDANAVCQSGPKPNGATCSAATDCGSGFCVDGVCCSSACTATCYSCSVPGTEGTCSPIPTGGVDPTAPTACASPYFCSKDHVCSAGKRPNGATCGDDADCGSSFCVDGTCCASSCTGVCRSCKNATGTCGMADDGDDPRKDCRGTSTACAGTCNGQGACRWKPQGTTCLQPGCTEALGLITGGGSCDGAGNCGYAVTLDCNGFGCRTDKTGGPYCLVACTQDAECASKRYCVGSNDGGVPDGGNGSACVPGFDNGHACTRNTQCLSGSCSDGVCCNINCDKCGTCNSPGSLGTCIPVPAGTDPGNECADPASDPGGMCKGICNGHAACTYTAAGTACGMCKACNGVGVCNMKPDDDPLCEPIDCDSLDTSCKDYHDLTTHRCAALGSCKTPNNPATCTDITSRCGVGGSGGKGGAAGAGGSSGGAGSGGSAGTSGGGSQGAAGEPVDGSANDSGGTVKSGGGGGCGCDLGGSTPVSAAPMLLGLGLILAGRRRPSRTR